MPKSVFEREIERQQQVIENEKELHLAMSFLQSQGLPYKEWFKPGK